MKDKKPAAGRSARPSAEELSFFADQVALLLRSGLPLYDGIEALCESYADARFYGAFQRMSKAVLETGSLSAGVSAADVFPAYFRQMVEIGEKTGSLDAVMHGLTAYYERESRVRRAIRSAVTYPLALIVMMAAVITVLVLKVLPIFRQVFAGMGMRMPEASSAMMRLGMGLGTGVLYVSLALLVCVLALAALLRTRARARVLAFLLRAVPALAAVNTKLHASRVSDALAMMLESGFPLSEALQLSEGLCTSGAILKKLRACRERVDAGGDFAQAMAETGLYEPLHERLIAVGYQAGQTDKVMRRLAGLYQEEMDDRLSRLVSIIEPSLVTVLSIIIGAILLSVMLPLSSLMSAML